MSGGWEPFLEFCLTLVGRIIFSEKYKKKDTTIKFSPQESLKAWSPEKRKLNSVGSLDRRKVDEQRNRETGVNLNKHGVNETIKE